ncbi:MULTISPECIES: ACT domain-containing protein [Peptostreptococcus]|uniref:ACT domain-containing protein n=1 Tax=Peptostreptococcus porci TaxID=2652282 RepID=A0A6N7XA40_9FIRM|nr:MULTISPECIES: ACT domain-containing protein [Peptostreptococcus]MDY2794847.1 ACT domain-containing protein [Peptostreptococcus porci]MDY4128470.1 ACT domain-containing protein [Peptostreptococcus porci]MDY4561920.1 ACT domain-containing protein [Peptostreptococcus porci]MDY5435361.1 ACT domain-containing protein [Peptostreptococcus porci]MDY5480154.1 ACT domain-containing protein [Peptostreptococcus porci]
METTLYARLTQGMDSFMRVSMTLRRREFKLKNISLSLEDNMMQMTVNEDESSSKSILNHLEKMYDVSDVTLEVKPVLSAVY